jgi:hypothetical protein
MARWNQVSIANIFYIFLAIAFHLFQHPNNMHIKSITHNSIPMFPPENLIIWRDSNPSLLSQRRMRCPQQLAALGNANICLLFTRNLFCAQNL